jgi:hypothetical protein
MDRVFRLAYQALFQGLQVRLRLHRVLPPDLVVGGVLAAEAAAAAVEVGNRFLIFCFIECFF